MTIAQLSHEKFNYRNTRPRALHAHKRFKPHTQQHPNTGPPQQTHSSIRSSLGRSLALGPEPNVNPWPSWIPHVQSMSSPCRIVAPGTRGTVGCYSIDWVCAHTTPCHMHANTLCPEGGGLKVKFWVAYNLSVTIPKHGAGDAPYTISFLRAVTMKEGFAVGVILVARFG